MKKENRDNEINARAKAFKTSQFIHSTYAWRFHCTVSSLIILVWHFFRFVCALIYVFRLKVLLRFRVVSPPLSPALLFSDVAWVTLHYIRFSSVIFTTEFLPLTNFGDIFLCCNMDLCKHPTILNQVHQECTQTSTFVVCLMNFTFRWRFDVSLRLLPPSPPPSSSLAHLFNFTLF